MEGNKLKIICLLHISKTEVENFYKRWGLSHVDY